MYSVRPLSRCKSPVGIRILDGDECYVVVCEAHLYGFMMEILKW